MMHQCIYSGTEFSKADGEHVLQDFLGARWTSNTIVCDNVQRQFGSTIDLGLEHGLREIRNLLGTLGGRGGAGPTIKNVKTKDGDRYHLLPGGKALLAEPIVKAESRANGTTRLNIQLNSMDQLAWALKKIKDQYPDVVLNEDELQNTRLHQGGMGEPVALNVTFGGADYARGLLKSAFNLLGARAPAVALSPSFDGIRQYVFSGAGNLSDYVRWGGDASPLEVPTLGQFDHFIGIFTHGSRVEGVVQFFGEISHLICLSTTYAGQPFQYGYLVNPFRDTRPAETREPEFRADRLPIFRDGHEGPTPTVRAAYRQRFERLLKKHYSRLDSTNISKIFDDFFSSIKEADRAAAVGQLAEKLAEYVLRRTSP